MLVRPTGSGRCEISTHHCSTYHRILRHCNTYMHSAVIAYLDLRILPVAEQVRHPGLESVRQVPLVFMHIRLQASATTLQLYHLQSHLPSQFHLHSYSLAGRVNIPFRQPAVQIQPTPYTPVQYYSHQHEDPHHSGPSRFPLSRFVVAGRTDKQEARLRVPTNWRTLSTPRP